MFLISFIGVLFSIYSIYSGIKHFNRLEPQAKKRAIGFMSVPIALCILLAFLEPKLFPPPPLDTNRWFEVPGTEYPTYIDKTDITKFDERAYQYALLVNYPSSSNINTYTLDCQNQLQQHSPQYTSYSKLNASGSAQTKTLGDSMPPELAERLFAPRPFEMQKPGNTFIYNTVCLPQHADNSSKFNKSIKTQRQPKMV